MLEPILFQLLLYNDYINKNDSYIYIWCIFNSKNKLAYIKLLHVLSKRLKLILVLNFLICIHAKVVLNKIK